MQEHRRMRVITEDKQSGMGRDMEIEVVSACIIGLPAHRADAGGRLYEARFTSGPNIGPFFPLNRLAFPLCSVVSPLIEL